jgi:drug/metabolite transporter (DMT)-like permease
VWSALGIVYVVWGSTYLAIRVMVETVPPLLGAGLRFGLAGAIMLTALAALGHAVHVTRRQLAGASLVGIALCFGGNGLVTVAERDVPSGLAALLVASIPLFIVVYRRLAGDRPARATLAGVVVGFLGVGVLLLPGGRPTGVPLGPTLLIVVAASLWALGSFGAQRLAMPSAPLVSTGWQMLVGGGAMLVCAVPAGELSGLDVAAFSTDSLLAFAYLVGAGSLVAFTAYAWLLQHAPISQVATYAYVNPVVAVVLGALILDETIGWPMLAGTALVLPSVAVIVRREAAERRASRAEVEPAPAAVAGGPLEPAAARR